MFWLAGQLGEFDPGQTLATIAVLLVLSLVWNPTPVGVPELPLPTETEVELECADLDQEIAELLAQTDGSKR